MFLASYSHAVAIFGFDCFSFADLVSVFDTRHGELCAILMELGKKIQKGGARLLAPLIPAASGTLQGASFQLCSPQTTAESLHYRNNNSCIQLPLSLSLDVFPWAVERRKIYVGSMM
jgi:hypothetical protein